MDNERLRILSMLQEGMITSSEAVELLKAIDPYDERNGSYGTSEINDNLSSSMENVIADFNKNTGNISEELSNKFSGMDKKLQEMMNISLEKLISNMEFLEKNLKSIVDKITQNLNENTDILSSKLKEETSNLTGLIVEKDGEEMGKLSRSMKDMQSNLGSIRIDSSALGEGLSGIFANLAQNVKSSRVISELYKKNIDDASSINLKFEALGGSLFLEGYDGDAIETEVYCRTTHESVTEAVLVTEKDDIYGICPISPNITSVQLDIKIPSKKFKEISVSTSDGKIEVSGISCECLFCTTSRGKLSLSNLSCGIIEAGTSEGKVSLSEIKSKKIFVNTFNSPILINSTFCKSSDMITANGAINLELNDSVNGNYEYKLTTENAPINVELSIPNGTGIFIDALSENGNISVNEIPDFKYNSVDSKSGSRHMTGQTSDFEKSESTIKIIAKNKNSQINFAGTQT